MKCPVCNADIADGSAFCTVCGSPIVQNENYKKQFNIGNHLFWIATFITGLSVFLNFLTISILGQSKSIMLFMSDGKPKDGVFFLILAVLALIFNACKLNGGNVVVSILAFSLMIIEIIDTQNLFKNQLEYYASYIKYGLGYYLLIIGTILMLATSILGLILQSSAKSKQNR